MVSYKSYAMKFFYAINFFIIASYGLANPANAQTLPAAVAVEGQSGGANGATPFGSLYDLNSAPPYSNSLSATGSQGAYAGSNLTVQAAPAPLIQASVTATNGSSLSSGTLTYSFEVTGPTATVPVFVTASGGITTSAQSSGNQELSAVSYLQVYNNNLNPLINDTLYAQYGPGVTAAANAGASIYNGTLTAGNATLTGGEASGYTGTLTESSVYTFSTNTVYTVSIDANAYAQTYGLGSESVSAFIDPSFTIADTVSDPQDYSIELSPSVGDSIATTPLPSTWAMLLGALASLAVFGYCTSHGSRR